MSPGFSPPASRRWTSPSISGASALERPVAPPSSSTAIDQHLDALADLGGELFGGDAGGELHDALVALFLDLFRHLVGQRRWPRRPRPARSGRRRRGRAGPLPASREDSRNPPRSRRGSRRRSWSGWRCPGTCARQFLQPLEHLGLVGRAAHRLSTFGAGVLEGDVEVGQHQPLGHQRDDLVDVRVGVDIVEADPGPVVRARRACPARGQGRSCGRAPRRPSRRAAGGGCRRRRPRCPG